MIYETHHECESLSAERRTAKNHPATIPSEQLSGIIVPGVRVGASWTCVGKTVTPLIDHGWPCLCGNTGRPSETCPVTGVRLSYVLLCDCGTVKRTVRPRESWACCNHSQNMQAWAAIAEIFTIINAARVAA